MKNSRESMAEIEVYSTRLGLAPRLIHISISTLQADTLHNIQSDCELVHQESYAMAKDRDSHDPSRDQKTIHNPIDRVKEYLLKHHRTSEIEMIAELDRLKERLDINDRMLKPEHVLNGVLLGITEQLESVGFSDTNIEEDLLPIFTYMIKNPE